ncbi:MAG: hypothetical protein GY715_14410 [Planctomycetes bacterium]|nr:hypothetical protein [Planctomycetota bacterium]
MGLFQNRNEAAHELSRLLTFLKPENPIVLGLANGGVPIAEIVAKSLEAPLDVMIAERLHAPKAPTHVVGAVDEHGRISMIRSSARWHHLTSQQMVGPAREVFRGLQRRRGALRAILPEMEVRDRTVIVVSQGVVSGAKMLGAIASVRDRGARKVVAAAPAGAGEATWQLQDAADLVVIPHRPTKFKGVEAFYQEYSEVNDETVLNIVERWVRERPQEEVGVQTIVMKLTNEQGHLLACEVDLPPGTTRDSGPYPVVVFAHGFESDGRNRRTVPISHRLAKRGIIGVRANFTGHGRSEGELGEATEARMAGDLAHVLSAVRHLSEVDSERIGLVGSASGAAIVLKLASSEPGVRGIVVRGPMIGGELELAAAVRPATLLVYAEQDEPFASDARRKADILASTHQVLEIPDSTRLFNDAISLEMMVGASVDWIIDHVGSVPAAEVMVDETDEEPATP